MTERIAGVRHPDFFEMMADAELTKTGTKVWNILQSRQEYTGTVRLRQKDIAERLGVTESTVSRALDELKERGLVHPQGVKRGVILINPTFAAYESIAHMVNYLENPETYVWPVTFPTKTLRNRGSDSRSGTGFDPDPDGGEELPLPEGQTPALRLVG